MPSISWGKNKNRIGMSISTSQPFISPSFPPYLTWQYFCVYEIHLKLALFCKNKPTWNVFFSFVSSHADLLTFLFDVSRQVVGGLFQQLCWSFNFPLEIYRMVSLEGSGFEMEAYQQGAYIIIYVSLTAMCFALPCCYRCLNFCRTHVSVNVAFVSKCKLAWDVLICWSTGLPVSRLEICRDRRDRRSCKFFPSCVKFWGNNANLLGNYRVIYALNE